MTRRDYHKPGYHAEYYRANIVKRRAQARAAAERRRRAKGVKQRRYRGNPEARAVRALCRRAVALWR